MRKLISTSLLVLSLLLAAAPSALGATEIGDSCAATGGVINDTFVQLSKNPASPPALVAPSAGVITSWKVNVLLPLGGKTYPSQLKVFRTNGGPKTFTAVGESSLGTVQQGANTFPTRIPIQAGDRLGFGGGEGVVQWYCETGDPLDVLGYVPSGNVPLGATETFPEEATEIQEAVTAVIEPDADSDGFGDETQDQCPQSAASQASCPVVDLSASARARKRSAAVLITSTIPAQVTVSGKVSLGKGRKATLKGGTKPTAAGTFTHFKLSFTAKLLKRLKELSSKQSLTLKITASAPNLVGAPTTKLLKLKLKGQG